MRYFWPVISAIIYVSYIVGMGAAWALGIVTIFGIYAADGVSWFTVFFSLLIAALLAVHIRNAVKIARGAKGVDS